MIYTGAPPINVGSRYASKTTDLCIPDDPVCAPGGGNNGAHSMYVADGLTDQAAEINQCALVNAAADFLCLVARSHREDDSPAFYAGDNRFRRHLLSYRRRREVPDVDDCAERGLAGRQVLANGV